MQIKLIRPCNVTGYFGWESKTVTETMLTQPSFYFYTHNI